MKKDWIDTDKAAVELGITPRQLLKLRSKGIFKSGKHYRKKESDRSQTYLYLAHRKMLKNS